MPTSHHHTKCSCRRQRPCQPVLGVSCPTTRLRVRPPRLPWNRFFVSDLRPVHHQLASASSPSHPFHVMMYCAFCNTSDSPPCHDFPCSAYSLPCVLLCFLCHVAVCTCTPLLTRGCPLVMGWHVSMISLGTVSLSRRAHVKPTPRHHTESPDTVKDPAVLGV